MYSHLHLNILHPDKIYTQILNLLFTKFITAEDDENAITYCIVLNSDSHLPINFFYMLA